MSPGPLAQDFLVFPARESSLAIRGSSPPLPDVNSPSNECVSFSFWEDLISFISPINPAILTLAPPVREGAGQINQKAAGEGRRGRGASTDRLSSDQGISEGKCLLVQGHQGVSREPSSSSGVRPRLQALRAAWGTPTSPLWATCVT